MGIVVSKFRMYQFYFGLQRDYYQHKAYESGSNLRQQW